MDNKTKLLIKSMNRANRRQFYMKNRKRLALGDWEAFNKEISEQELVTKTGTKTGTL